MDKESSVEWLIDFLSRNDYLKKEIPQYVKDCAIQVHKAEIKMSYLADDINRMEFELGKCDKRLNMETYYQKEYGKEVTNE